ncbi:MAG: alpha/beta fold hydrolase [Bacteroidota bacterium]
MELYHQHYGEGSPMIILHGLFGMSDNWVSLAKRFAAHYSVHVIDQRNHGRSGWHEVFNYEAMADDIEEFMDDHQIESAILLGHSMGGKTAMQFSLDHPEKINKLIVADISADEYNHKHDAFIDAMLSIDLKGKNSRNEVSRELKEKIGDDRIRQFLMKNLHWKDRSTLGWKANLEVINKNLSHIFRAIDSSHPYPKPTLFIRGGESLYIRQNHIPRIKKLFPQARIETIEGASHWLHAEKPDEFYDLVMDFLQQ